MLLNSLNMGDELGVSATSSRHASSVSEADFDRFTMPMDIPLSTFCRSNIGSQLTKLSGYMRSKTPMANCAAPAIVVVDPPMTGHYVL